MKRVLIFFLFPFFIYSQSSISGKITDVDGNVIMGANIIAVNNETNVLDGFGISNENGFYNLNLKNNTEFNIKVTFIGFTPVEFNISLTQDITRNFIDRHILACQSYLVSELMSKEVISIEDYIYFYKLFLLYFLQLLMIHLLVKFFLSFSSII